MLLQQDVSEIWNKFFVFWLEAFMPLFFIIDYIIKIC